MKIEGSFYEEVGRCRFSQNSVKRLGLCGVLVSAPAVEVSCIIQTGWAGCLGHFSSSAASSDDFHLGKNTKERYWRNV